MENLPPVDFSSGILKHTASALSERIAVFFFYSLNFAAVEQSKEHEIDEGFADVIEKGWLVKEGANDDSRRKRRVRFIC